MVLSDAAGLARLTVPLPGLPGASLTRASLAQSARYVVGRALEQVPSPTEPLAEPPRGSGLKPVMGDWGLPIAGHLLSMGGDMIGFSRRRVARYGPVSWGGVLGTKAVSVLGPDGIEAVALNRDRAFGNAGFYEYLIGPFFHRGVMLLDFDEHLFHRRIMQEAFTRPRLRGYLQAMNGRIAHGLAEWRPAAAFPIYTRVKGLTLAVGAEAFMGTSPGAEADRLNGAFVDAVLGGQAIVRAPVPGGRWWRGLRGRRFLEEYLRAQLPAKRRSEGQDLFSVLCHAQSEDGHRFSDEDIVNHMIFVLMAAHDTSTITVAMMAHQLGKHRDWQRRARRESQALGHEQLEFDDLERLEALDLVMKETLRINAPVGALFRETVKDTALLGHYIPRGTRLIASIYPTQRMEPWWPNPDRFDPLRFAEPRREDRSHRYAWAPFGGGAHKCIGMHFAAMEVKAIMHQLLLRFRWTVPGHYEPPLHYGTGPTPSDGLPIHLERL